MLACTGRALSALFSSPATMVVARALRRPRASAPLGQPALSEDCAREAPTNGDIDSHHHRCDAILLDGGKTERTRMADLRLPFPPSNNPTTPYIVDALQLPHNTTHDTVFQWNSLRPT